MYNDNVFEVTTWFKPFMLPITNNLYPSNQNKTSIEFIYVNMDIPAHHNTDGSDLWGNNFISSFEVSNRFYLHTDYETSDLYPLKIYYVNPINKTIIELNNNVEYTIDPDNPRLILLSTEFTNSYPNGLIYGSYIPTSYDLSLNTFKQQYPSLQCVKMSSPIYKNHIIRIRQAINDIVSCINVIKTESNDLTPFRWTGGFDNTMTSTDPAILSVYSLFSDVIINEIITAINTILTSNDYIKSLPNGDSIGLSPLSSLDNVRSTASYINDIHNHINLIEAFLITYL